MLQRHCADPSVTKVLPQHLEIRALGAMKRRDLHAPATILHSSPLYIWGLSDDSSDSNGQSFGI